MAPGQIDRLWRETRSKVHAFVEPGYFCLDLESPVTKRFLQAQLQAELDALGCVDLDIGAARGADRRVTRLIAEWVYEQEDDEGDALFAGVRYESRLVDDMECWALFDDIEMLRPTLFPILESDPALQRAASIFGLRVH